MKNPAWTRDEIILALELYLREKHGEVVSIKEERKKLSELLNTLPIYQSTERNNTFRNVASIGRKMGNFQSVDPDYTGKGLDRINKLDKIVFDEFKDKRAELINIANRIKTAVSNPKQRQKLLKAYEVNDTPLDEVREGRVLYRAHKVRERSPKLAKRKKASRLKQAGKLTCDVCGFDFQEFYGELGQGYIECHHKISLSELDVESTTKLKDLALVCANCHRMLHRKISTLSVEELKRIVNGEK